jgi:periplasmic divalent cation tolerance protein
MERAMLVYTTWPSVVEAERAGRSLVERRLAACVNVLPGMISHYWWKGAIERAEEAVAIFKTRASLVEPLRAAMRAEHSYETPGFVAVDAHAIDPDYHAWLVAETARLN